MSDLAKRIGHLSPEKRELLDLLLSEEPTELPTPGAVQLPTITPAPAQRYLPFPLTDVQQAYWIGRSGDFDLGNIACHNYIEFDSVDLDLGRLTRTWQRLIERHDMLRATVRSDGQQQILAQVPPYCIEVLDLRACAPQEKTAQLEAVRERMSHQVLPTDRWPLFEIRVSRLDGHRARIHFSMDTLIADGGSVRIITQELDQLYRNPSAALPPLELSFRDYVLAEVALRDTEIYQRSLEYWQNRLQTLPSAPELPLAKNPSAVIYPRFVRRRGTWSAADWRRLKDSAKQSNVTPSAVLLAAYAEVLATWSANPHFAINVPQFNRLPLHNQVNNLVGEFASFSLLEVDNSGQASFECRARRIQEQLWKDLNHGYVSGVRVLRELTRIHGEGSPASMPIVFTSTVALDTLALNISSLTMLGEEVYSIAQTPQVWLDLQVFEQDGTLVFNWDAVEELFPSGLMDAMFGAYSSLLRRLTDERAAWTETMRSLAPMAQLEQRAVINANQAPIPEELIQTGFEKQVPQRPQQAAVITSNRTLSYAELDCRANHMARRLREFGAQPNTLIAVVMEKGWEQIVAVLGIVKSGAAYLPIDPEVPQERLWYLLENSQVKFVLTQSWLDESLIFPPSVQRLQVDADRDWATSDQPLDPVQSPNDLAFVIYTSGSTGLPKGAMIAHRGVVNAIVQTNQHFAIRDQDRVLALTALHHDMSVYDIFGVLAAGGTLVIPEASARLDPAHWAALIAREQVTLWNSVPAMMEMLLEYAIGRAMPLSQSLRLAFLGGDWIPMTLPGRLRALIPTLQLVSVGGPTETTLWNIWYPVEQVNPDWKSIPYGHPIANTHYYVLNETLDDRPVWVPGEIYCAGVGVAKGYWRDDEKNQAKFVQHPRTGERLYRTGDMGRYLPDGNIEFLGRADFQVKILGYRIEPGEIEAALGHHPRVRGAVVTALGEPHGHKRLVAYIVPEKEPESEASEQSLLNDWVESHESRQLEGVLTDPVDRLEFKLKQPGVRRDDADRPSIQLEEPPLDDDVLARYIERRSYRKFLREPIAFGPFGEFLSCLRQMQLEGLPFPKYQYASGGGIYPVQLYLYVKPNRIEGIPAGTYYYHPQHHRLVQLTADAVIERSIHVFTNRSIFDESAFSILLVGQLGAITPMYGEEKSRHYCALEAGLIAQLLEMTAPTYGVGLCQIGALDFERVRHLFALEASHIYLHGLLGGRIEPQQNKREALLKDWSAYRALPLEQAAKNEAALIGELRHFLEERLPRQMLPSDFVLLERLPLTANGKVDRRALPVPRQGSPDLTGTFVAPRNAVEERLAKIWAETLGVAQVGVYDNFFELGGDSLRAVQLANRISEAFQIELALRQLLKASNVAQLAELIEQSVRAEIEALSEEEAQRLAEGES